MSDARRVAFALGANLGDRVATLDSAVDALGAGADFVVTAVSPLYETTPVGGPPGQPPYLNAVVVGTSYRTPDELLALAHRVEDAHGRVRTEHWGARTLDVDLLAVDALTVEGPDLTLPHPRAHERAFVLAPWADVDPDFDVPGHGRVRDLLVGLPATARAGVRLAEADDAGRAPR